VIKIIQDDNRLLLNYQPDRFTDAGWLDDKLKKNSSVTLRRTFTFTPADLVSHDTRSGGEEDDGERIFVLGTLDNDFYKVSKEILGLKHDLLLSKVMKIKTETFIANRNISVFGKIDELIDEPIIVGREKEGAIPLVDFEQLLKTFPTTTELTHYARTRVARVLKDYFGTLSDAEGQLNRYLNNKKILPTQSRESIVATFEVQKFEYIQSELQEMLTMPESYLEKDWQKKILGLLLFIFPKYIAVIEEVVINDYYSCLGKVSEARIDLLLVDAGGNVDLIEVKRPDPDSVITRHKYRKKHHTPRSALTSAVMQAEKYLFHLSKWGRLGEEKIYVKYKNELPEGITLQITNPKAFILIGRDNDFNHEQRFDFEIIRRKYANMIDIMTYDDLLRSQVQILL
jgi:hypothetical protein